MEPNFPKDQDNDIRFSDSPRRWTQITQSLPSPVKSVRPHHSIANMESLDSQIDFGHRTIDFFDDESSDEEPLTVRRKSAISQAGLDVELREPSDSSGKRKSQHPHVLQPLVSQCERKEGSTVQPEREEWPLQQGLSSEGYQRLDSKRTIPMRTGSMESTSYNGSVVELDRGPVDGTPRAPKPVRIPSERTARGSGDGKNNPRQSIFRNYSDKADHRLSVQAEQRLGVHALAYDVLLSGLLRDEEVMRPNRSNSKTPQTRSSLTPQQHDANNPRTPRDHLFSQAIAERAAKKVHVVPPPIQIGNSLPEEIVRTPYPFSTPRRKNFDQEAPSRPQTPSGSGESVLTLSIHRSNRNSLPRVTSLTLPTSNDFTTTRSSREISSPENPSPPFDDQAFFHQLQLSYIHLAGPFRLLSARTLTRIRVSGPASQAADSGYGWLHQPRSPRVLARRGLTDTFSEEKIFQHYRRPALGKSRYAFVHWAHRLAAAAAPPPTRMAMPGVLTPTTPERELVREREQSEGLEFVVNWSVRRILLGLLLVVLMSIAAGLLWIFLGKNNTSSRFPAPQRAGFRGAGDRVGTGVVLGICVLLFGLSSIAGWLGVSWLVL